MRRLWERVCRVIDWLPVIWNDYDFDSAYLYPYMLKKLERLEPAIRNGCASNSEEVSREVRTAIALLKRIINRDYSANAYVWVEREYGDFSENVMLPTENDNVLRFETRPKYPMSDKEFRRAKKQQLRAFMHARHVETQDKKYLFQYLAKHINKWWD